MRAGSLTVVGTGIQLVAHTTHETLAVLERADEVLYVVADPAAGVWLRRVNPRARSLGDLYEPGRGRHEIYAAMVEEILAAMRRGSWVCAAFYGHPGVFVLPSHEAVARARAEGYEARMLPGISAEDCLFADLGVDPAEQGCQSYEATEFLLRRHAADPTAALILWQIDVIGVMTFDPEPSPAGLRLLAEHLLGLYPPDHEVVVYAASLYPISGPIIERLPLAQLADFSLVPMATLYVPPLPPPPLDPEVMERLGMTALMRR